MICSYPSRSQAALPPWTLWLVAISKQANRTWRWPWALGLGGSNVERPCPIYSRWWFGTFVVFHLFGIIIPIDFHIFQRGWNHQPVFIFLTISGWWWLEHEWIIFPFTWEFHHPNWRTPIFFRGVFGSKPPTRYDGRTDKETLAKQFPKHRQAWRVPSFFRPQVDMFTEKSHKDQQDPALTYVVPGNPVDDLILMCAINRNSCYQAEFILFFFIGWPKFFGYQV